MHAVATHPVTASNTDYVFVAHRQASSTLHMYTPVSRMYHVHACKHVVLLLAVMMLCTYAHTV